MAMAAIGKGSSDDQATSRNGDSSNKTFSYGKKKRKGGPKVKSGCLTCKYVIRSALRHRLTGADFGELSATRESLLAKYA
jgi:hypothetical protein